MKKNIRMASSTLAPPSLIPQPLQIKDAGGVFSLDGNTDIIYSDKAARSPVEMLAAQLRPATGLALQVKEKANFSPAKGAIIFQIQEDETLGLEGYELHVAEEGISIKAQAPAGLFYGAQTLRQLLPAEVFSTNKVSEDWKIPGVEIRDFPRFRWRGTMLDSSRHFTPKADVLKFIDTIAALKLNTFHWHLTDDQGWRIEIKKYPRLTEIGAWRDGTMIGHLTDENMPVEFDNICHGGFYTQDDIREIVAYAGERHIMIVPEIDMPGHMEAAISAYPELGCTGKPTGIRKKWGISDNILSPEESSVQFCKDVLSEVMALFPSRFIHIGGDEAKKSLWETSERIQQLREERGLADMHEMQAWFTAQISEFLVANNRCMIGWDEIGEGQFPEGAAVMWWRGGEGRSQGTPIARAAAKSGHGVVIATSEYLYFDYHQDKNDLPVGSFLPLEKVYSFDPVLEGVTEEESKHVLGVQGQLWSEYMPTMEQVEYMAFPRALALAELAWLPKEKKNYASFLDRLKIQEKRFDAAGVNYRPDGAADVE